MLAVIAGQARASNQARAEVIAGVMDEIAGAATEQIDHAVRSAHQLAGSAGTFGMPTASRLARRLERFLAEAGFRDEVRLTEARADLVELQKVLAVGE